MSLSERIKEVRKAEGLTQQAFGERIRIKQNSVALIESGKRNASDQTILAICREFSVNETWLRTGEGAMKPHEADDEVGACLKKWGLPDEFRGLFLAYRKLPTDEDRASVRMFVRKFAEEILQQGADSPKASEPEEAAVSEAKNIYDWSEEDYLSAVHEQFASEKKPTDASGDSCSGNSGSAIA